MRAADIVAAVTMTLSFGVGFVLDTVVDPAIAQAALVTLAQHSPAGVVRHHLLTRGG
jgi:hypothetical protein